MKNIEFKYKMEINFSLPVLKHCYSLRCIPFNNTGQKILEINTEISPENVPTYTTDGFGNTVLTDRITDEHQKFTVNVCGKAQIDFSKREKEVLNPIYKYPSELTKPGDNIYNFIAELPIDIVSTPSETAMKITQRLHQVFSYKSKTTSINTTADDAIEMGCGVCQDYSHILISVCRFYGIPARYVAGIQKGIGETHAWVEVYENGFWVGVDVTNNKTVDETYLKLSHGRDFNDCGLNRGMLIGGGTQSQNIIASVNEI